MKTVRTKNMSYFHDEDENMKQNSEPSEHSNSQYSLRGSLQSPPRKMNSRLSKSIFREKRSTKGPIAKVHSNTSENVTWLNNNEINEVKSINT